MTPFNMRADTFDDGGKLATVAQRGCGGSQSERSAIGPTSSPLANRFWVNPICSECVITTPSGSISVYRAALTYDAI